MAQLIDLHFEHLGAFPAFATVVERRAEEIVGVPRRR